MPNKCFVTGCRTGYYLNKHVEAEVAEQGKAISTFPITNMKPLGSNG